MIRSAIWDTKKIICFEICDQKLVKATKVMLVFAQNIPYLWPVKAQSGEQR